MNLRIKELRESLGMTQQKFADELHVNRNNIAGYETDTRKPSEAVISLICKQFNVNEEWLRNGTGEMYIEIDRDAQLMQWAGSVLGDDNDFFKQRFVKMLASLSEDEWSMLEKRAEELVAAKKKD